MSFNKIIILGYLGRNPEMRYTPQGTPVCDFSVATSEKRKDQAGEMKEETTWFKVTFFGKQAEVASQYLSKGKQVYVEGRLRAREWTDKDGKTRTSLEVTGTDLRLIGSKGDEAGAEGPPAAAKAAAPAQEKGKGKAAPADFDDTIDESDIPF